MPAGFGAGPCPVTICGVDEQAFHHAITNGLGRAILWLRANPWRPHADAIAEVCLHNTAYDPQCEGSRAEYVHEIVALTDARERFAETAVACLLGGPESYWDTEHLFHLCRLFAQDGYAPARTALYERFGRSHPEDPFLGDDEIVALDGIAGLVFVMERVGRHLAEDRDYWVDDGLVREVEARFGSDAVASAIREAAANNADVARYMEAVGRYRARPRGRTPPEYRDLPWPELRRRIECGDASRACLAIWGRHAPEDVLREAAATLLGELDERRLLGILAVFQRRAFPLDPARLIELAASDRDEIGTSARRALRHIQSESVRALALDRLSRTGAGGNDVLLLVKNYRAGDESMIASLLDRTAGDDAFHSIANDAIKVFEHNSEADAIPSLLRIYERGRCGLCRHSAVKLLLTRQQAPEWMLAECRYDSDPDTRALVMQPSRSSSTT